MTATRHPFAVELRALLAIAAPLAAANVAQMLMELTSTIMVGHLGSAALASAGLGGSLYFTLVIVCRSVLAAVAPLAAHALGADEHHEAGLLAGTGLVMAGIIAMPIISQRCVGVRRRFLRLRSCARCLPRPLAPAR